jgi:8-oxo-dGTP pyrophosphatase MutT (NUDIX family)
VEDGETLRVAAVRELAEEIGLVVEPALLEGPVWLRRNLGVFAGQEIDSRETFFVLRDVVHEVDPGGRTELEVLGDEPHRWWSPGEVAASTEEFAPGDLAERLPELLTGPWAGPPRVVS